MQVLDAFPQWKALRGRGESYSDVILRVAKASSERVL